MKLSKTRTAVLFVSLLSSAVPVFARPSLIIVLVIDGLRPDSITPDIAPNLARLKTEGVSYNHAHSVYPTVTRVNSTSISTGAMPSSHGIVGNSLYIPKISPKVLNTADYLSLLKLGDLNRGRVIPLTTLGEELERNGIRYVALGSGSTGAALLLNHLAPSGKGSLINPGFEGGKRVAFPDALNTEILFRVPPVKELNENTGLVWTERVLREYVLTEMRPQVIVDWMSPTDGAQHAHGVGSPEAVAALRLVDRQIGLLQEKLAQLGLKDKTDIIVTCDHGFDYEPPADVLAPLKVAGVDGNEVVVDNEGGGSLLYVKGHDPEKIQRLAEAFQRSDKTNVIFVAARRPERGTFQCNADATKGWLPGTFALDLAYQCLPAHGPDLIVTFHWDKSPNPFGVPGTQWVPGNAASGQPAHNGHGGLNPWAVRSTLLLSGPDFRHRATSDTPAGNQDIAPTVLSLEGQRIPDSMQGRILAEAMQKAEGSAAPAASTRRLEVSRGDYCAAIEVSSIGKQRYLDYGSRCADPVPSLTGK